MAFLALGAVAAIVHVILLVAADAVHRQACFSGDRPRVAGITVQRLVPAIQPEAGFGVMVEIPQAPVAGVVAALALRAQAALVHVFFLMTGHALGFGVLELRGQMAFLALDHHMLPGQRKA